MPSSVSTFSITASDIISAALRKLDVIGVGETPLTEDFTNCLFGLNIMVKSWQTDGYYLWKVEEILVPMVAATNTYQIGPTATGPGAVVTNRPLRIREAYIRDASGNDTTLLVTSRQEWVMLGQKTSQGVPNQLWYDPQLTNGVITVFNVPIDATSTIHLIAQMPIFDFTATTDTPDFPQEAYQALVWGLAEEMAAEYRPTDKLMQVIMNKSKFYRDQLINWSQEEASTYFMPNYQMLTQRRY
jgi:hypothetical protein